jgi:hypothetical protein
MFKSIAEKFIPDHLPESVLDDLWRLSQRRVLEIENSPLVVSCNGRQIRSVQDGLSFSFIKDICPTIGSIIRNGNEFGGNYLVTDRIEEAGRARCLTYQLPDSVDIYSRSIRDYSDFDRRPIYRTRIEYLGIPAVISDDLERVTLPQSARVESGDLFLIEHKYYLVNSVKQDGHFTFCSVKFWLDAD